MTLLSMCGVTTDAGRDCTNAVDPESPLNLCDEHYRIAFEWVNSKAFPELPPCEVCKHRERRPGREGYRCAFCGHLSPDYRT